MTTWEPNEDMRMHISLLGKKVKVTLEVDESLVNIAKGTLLRISNSGEVVILDDMGFLHFCWPALDVVQDG